MKAQFDKFSRSFTDLFTPGYVYFCKRKIDLE